MWVETTQATTCLSRDSRVASVYDGLCRGRRTAAHRCHCRHQKTVYGENIYPPTPWPLLRGDLVPRQLATLREDNSVQNRSNIVMTAN